MRSAISKLRGDCVNCGQRFCVCNFRGSADVSSEWAGGIFGGSIQIGWDVKIRIIPNQPWTAAKVFFFDGLAAIVGADLTDYEQGLALCRLVEGINNDPEHDSGGWLAVHSRSGSGL